MYSNATNATNGAAITHQDAQTNTTQGLAHYALGFIYLQYVEHIKTIPLDRRVETAKDHMRQYQNPAQLQKLLPETC